MRPSEHETWLLVAHAVAARGTCRRRRVGCVLVSSDGQVLSTGYNGVAPGAPHCTDHPCPGAAAATGTDLGACEAIHAEQNALIACRDFAMVDRVYVTASPCVHCAKMLLRTPARAVYFMERYAHDEAASALWTSRTAPGSLRLRDWVEYRSPPIDALRVLSAARSSAADVARAGLAPDDALAVVARSLVRGE